MLKILDLTTGKDLDGRQMTEVRGGFYSYYSAWGYTGRSTKAYPTIPNYPNYNYSPSRGSHYGVTNPDI